MEEQVILEFIDFFKFFFIKPGLVIHYLNEIFSKKFNSMQYIEEIDNGFLFVFKDFDSFKFRAKPLSKSVLSAITIPERYKDNFFTKFFIPKEEFPKEGVKLEIKIISGDKSEVIPILKEFINSISKFIEFELDKNQKIYFTIPKFEIIQNYANSLMHRFYL